MKNSPARVTRRGRSASLALVLLILASSVSCSEKPVEPVAFSMGQPIPMGPYTLKVSHVEVGDFSSLSGLDFAQGVKGIAVYMTVSSKKSIEEKEMEAFRKGHKKFSLEDGSGRTYISELIMFTDAFRAYRSAAQARDLSQVTQYTTRLKYALSQGKIDIVIIFGVPFDSRGYTLFIENTRPQEGQPRISAIPLGR